MADHQDDRHHTGHVKNKTTDLHFALSSIIRSHTTLLLMASVPPRVLPVVQVRLQLAALHLQLTLCRVGTHHRQLVQQVPDQQTGGTALMRGLGDFPSFEQTYFRATHRAAAAQEGEQHADTEGTGVQSHDPALTWMKEMVTLLETKQGKGESEGLADSLCGGAKWSRQKVGSWHAAEVVGPAGETRQDPEKNKHGTCCSVTLHHWSGQETDAFSVSTFRCLTCTNNSSAVHRKTLKSPQEADTSAGIQTEMASVKKDDRLTSSQSFMCVGFAGFFSKTVTLVHLHMDELGFISQWRAILAGGLAGAVAALTTYPLEVAETRLIAQNCRQPVYMGVVHTISKIYRNEGLLALYRGFSLTLLGAIPFSIGCYAVHMNLDKLWREPSFRFTPLQNFINGCLAAGVAQTLSYPFETVKRKMQAQSARLPHLGGVDVHFTGMMDCFIQVVKNKGVLSLWNGLTANTIKVVPYFGLLFTCFEMCKQVSLYRNGYIVSPLSYKLTPGVDQSLGPSELEEAKRYLKNRDFGSSLGKC
ncbi:hypothetical protein F7725_010338 [Dissostichus mawsoni]|uniref:Solute carrier family 25 member 43 n=1 Tax=Dissostichus mawsoni TaxID=36200 RepID=A0A7J5XNJ2_DISMA|nr:hypothetical protein F7725_010338 [Dissostichus mawsoni]